MSTIRWVRTLCDQCGSVSVLREEVLLTIFPTGAVYTFQCPRCHRRLVREASPEAVVKLVDAEVPTHRISLPERPARDGPPIDHDTVLDFVLELEASDDPLEELT